MSQPRCTRKIIEHGSCSDVDRNMKTDMKRCDMSRNYMSRSDMNRSDMNAFLDFTHLRWI